MTQKTARLPPRRLKGFRDLMPSTMSLRQHVLAAARRVAYHAGFLEIGTPALEYAETLLGPAGGETEKQVYTFEDQGGRMVALRYDLTVPFARFVAEHQQELPFPFKKLQIGEVWRGENPQKGRYREFGQCDFDLIGADSAASDVEVLLALTQVLLLLPCGALTLRVNHRVLLSAILRAAYGAEWTLELEQAAMIILDKLDKIGPAAVATQLNALAKEQTPAEWILATCTLSSGHSPQEALAAYREQVAARDPEVAATLPPVLSRFEITLEILAQQLAETSIQLVFDLHIARGLGYYTGIVFETTLDALPGYGSIASGGRYNNLADRFTSRALPGVGGSIGFDRLVAALEEMGVQPNAYLPHAMVAIAVPEALPYAFSIVKELRAQGIPTEIAVTEGKLATQFKQGSRLGVRFMLTVGDLEMSAGTVNCKEMLEGKEQRGIPLHAAIAWIRGEERAHDA